MATAHAPYISSSSDHGTQKPPIYRLLLLIALLIPCWVIAVRYVIDIKTIHYIAQLIPTDVTQAYEPPNGNIGRFFYGPISLVLLKPLAALSLTQLQYVWITFQTIAYALFWICLYRLFPFLSQRAGNWKWILIFVVAINPIHNNFQSNNIQLMIASCLLLVELLSRTNSSLARFFAGALCMVPAMIKVFPLFLVGYYFLTRGRAMRSGLIAGTLILAGLPFAVFGTESASLLYQGFFRNLTSYAQDNSLVGVVDILCLPSLMARWLTPFFSQGSIDILIKITIFGISTIFYLVAWRSSQSKTLWAHAWLLMALLNPSTRVHYFIFLIPAFCLLIEDLQPQFQWVSALSLLLATTLIAFTTEGVVGRELNNTLEAWSFPTVGILILGAGIFFSYLASQGPRNRALTV